MTRLTRHEFPGGMAGAGVEPVSPEGGGIGIQTSVDGGSSSTVPLSGFVFYRVAGGGNESTGSRSSLPYRKRGSRGGFKSRFAWFLQSVVRGPRVIRRMASRPRPITFEPLPAKIKVQNGSTHFDQGCNPTRRLGMLDRPKGR